MFVSDFGDTHVRELADMFGAILTANGTSPVDAELTELDAECTTGRRNCKPVSKVLKVTQ